MPHPKLLRLAETEVERARGQLPEEVRAASEECLVTYEDIEDALEEDDELPDDLLGLFEGYNRMDPLPAGPADMPRIRLFLDNLWDYASGDEHQYRKEVRVTWLHELGHYLGWGEEEIEALGLG
ncbi:metallopeptidase family protein [Roseimicrobium sp. ORNL1]|uniref:metallopeptidase family protein n=1 Tax=Roseimicrobium sp. ORNL1 TaxID=2711231 RepID=UPI0013E13538|nr:metallopeptidase family protein [Roseimicrobium sp. ORNL1]QIF05677.1 metallopeptidase family protein [Roseimicrobium sp. ORNL1]